MRAKPAVASWPRYSAVGRSGCARPWHLPRSSVLHVATVEQADALVLRAVDYGESDRVVTLFTREHGCVSAMARAARKSKRRFAGALEGFALIHVELSTGR